MQEYIGKTVGFKYESKVYIGQLMGINDDSSLLIKLKGHTKNSIYTGRVLVLL